MAKKSNELNEERKQQEEANKRKRIEEAKRIAVKSQEIIDYNYNAIAHHIVKFFRYINAKMDFILTNSTTSKLVSLLLAVLLYISINYSGDVNVFGQSNVGKDMYGVSVKAIYDDEKFQIENLPETVDLSLVGSVEAIRKTEVLNKEEVIADLTNYKAGINQKIHLLYSGVADGVSVKFSQPSYEVNIYDKKREVFAITPELIKVPTDNKYNYDVKLSVNSIEIKAAQHTLDKIASVKAMVDVSSQKKNFKQEATLVVIDQEGNKIEGITLSFDKVNVSVKVTKKIKKDGFNG
ncbi:YbbR domain-containing protein [Bacilli bacterium PM5-3]|nr:YbbR domain-containing protein [Bacilli bacterium PM5-3]